jgi:hypothetical protein
VVASWRGCPGNRQRRQAVDSRGRGDNPREVSRRKRSELTNARSTNWLSQSQHGNTNAGARSMTERGRLPVCPMFLNLRDSLVDTTKPITRLRSDCQNKRAIGLAGSPERFFPRPAVYQPGGRCGNGARLRKVRRTSGHCQHPQSRKARTALRVAPAGRLAGANTPKRIPTGRDLGVRPEKNLSGAAFCA